MVRACLLLSLCVASALAQAPDWQSVEQAIGRKGTTQGDIIKFAFPVGGHDIPPPKG